MDLFDFNKGQQFDENTELNINVKSDHAEIRCEILKDNLKINVGAFNISNKEYHPYFGLNESAPFRKTHMYVPKNSEDEMKNKWLLYKTEKQLMDIVKNFAKQLDIYVIVEGYYEFYNTLSEKLKTINMNFEIINILKDKEHGYTNKPWNITGIIVNTDKFQIEKFEIIKETYQEEQEPGKFRDSKFITPWVKLTHKQTNYEFIIIGVHIAGCESQNPKNGLKKLSETINRLKKENNCDIIALGDFNTIPNNIMKNVTQKIVEPKYPTHINPYNQICVYDNIIYELKDENENIKIHMLDLNETIHDSNNFVKSLIENFNITNSISNNK